jgi:DNA-binding LacI/PurR family transcriptional regulator
MSITIKDVARKTGVSISTVSKVINNWPTISESTATRVREAMKELEYTPNTRATNFARKSTKDIAFLAPMEKGQVFQNPHLFETMCGVHHSIAKKEYTLSMVNASSDTASGEIVQSIVTKQAFDGMIVHGSAITPEIANLIIRKDFPHILIGKPDFESHLCWVDTNHVLEGDVAARHLVQTGCRKILFIAGDKTGKISKDRVQGFLSVMEEYHLTVPDKYIQYVDSNKELCYAVTMEWLAAKNLPDAIICESNQMAMWTLKALREKQFILPNDISLITFDDYPLSRIMEPSPTVVDIDVYDLGVQAGSMLLRKIKNRALQIQSYTTLPTLIQRNTSKEIQGSYP